MHLVGSSRSSPWRLISSFLFFCLFVIEGKEEEEEKEQDGDEDGDDERRVWKGPQLKLIRD